MVVLSANSNYELGRGDRVGGWKPKPIPSLEDVRVIQIASGGYHSLALTGKVIAKSHDCCRKCMFVIGYILLLVIYCWRIISDDGKVLSWGHGGHGQLGHSSIQNQKVPLLIEALSNEHVVYIACEGSSSAAITGKTTVDFFDSIFAFF